MYASSSSSLSCCLLLLFLVIISIRKKKEIQQIVKKTITIKKGIKEMQELANRFIGLDVYMKTVSGEVEDGILKEVVDNCAVLEKDGKIRVVNLDYVVRLMEYPKNKKGKRKVLVLD